MANFYVRSTDGSDADNGTTWALAKATLAGALNVATAGDTIFVSDNHAETQASAMTLSSQGTAASPVRILCADDSAVISVIPPRCCCIMVSNSRMICSLLVANTPLSWSTGVNFTDIPLDRKIVCRGFHLLKNLKSLMSSTVKPSKQRGREFC